MDPQAPASVIYRVAIQEDPDLLFTEDFWSD